MKTKGQTGKGSDGEAIFTGLGVSPGVGIGTIFRHSAGVVRFPEYHIAPSKLEAERIRFRHAAASAAREVGRLLAKAKGLPGAAAEEMSYLLEAHQQMLKGSRLLRGVEKRIGDDRINAEAAVQREIAEISAGFAAMEDSYLAARIDDIRDVGQRLLRNLAAIDTNPFAAVPPHSVVAAEELTPADTALLDPKMVVGIATTQGGAEGHTAIMARSLGLPAVLGVAGMHDAACDGDTVIVDGSEGRVVLRPDPQTLAQYRKKRADLLRQKRQLDRLRNLPAVTRDGVQISLEANLELPGEVDAVLAAGARGIGLLRTEFLFMNRDTLPSEDEQYAVLSALVRSFAGKPVTVRTLDAGGDKLPELSMSSGANPALGLRAIRLGLLRPEILETQLAAMLRAAAHGPLRILVPMISSVDEIISVREIMRKIYKRLKRRRVALPDALPPLGVMIEVPGAALNADALAWNSDFFAIGTNDLTMYTLAIDRGDQQVAHLYNPSHPAVLRLIQFAVVAAQRANLPVSVCGEMAGDPRFTALLLGLGIRELSMSIANIPRVKQRIRALDLGAAARRARTIMEHGDPQRVARMIDELNKGF